MWTVAPVSTTHTLPTGTDPGRALLAVPVLWVPPPSGDADLGPGDPPETKQRFARAVNAERSSISLSILHVRTVLRAHALFAKSTTTDAALALDRVSIGQRQLPLTTLSTTAPSLKTGFFAIGQEFFAGEIRTAKL